MKKLVFNLALLFSSIAIAQTIQFEETSPLPNNVNFEGLTNSSLAIADIDGDNDQDLLITGRNSSNVKKSNLYINDGFGGYTLATNTPFDGVMLSDVAFSDVDGDNDQDLLITGYSSSNYNISKLYLNNGIGLFTLAINTPFEAVRQSSIAFADIDEDNDQDLLITGFNQQGKSVSNLYINDGLGNYSLVTNTPFTSVHNSSVAFSDIDGDNDQDVIISGLSSSNYPVTKLYSNDGVGNFNLTNNSFIGVQNGSIKFSDIDGDKDQDLLITGLNSSSIAKLYKNDGVGNYQEINSQIEGVQYSSVAFSDIDGDNDQDVLISGRNNSNQPSSRLYLNNDGGGNYTLNSSSFYNCQNGDIEFSDVDGDEDEDLILIGNNNSSQRVSKLYLNKTITCTPTWDEITKVNEPNGAANRKNGWSTAISGNRAVVGNWAGLPLVYVYELENGAWQYKTTLQSSTNGGGWFGYSVDISGDYIIVGSNYDAPNGAYSGSAYVYHWNGTDWSEETKLIPLDGATGDQFGRAVAIEENKVIIGSSLDDDNGSNSGSAYIFEFDGNNWNETSKLTANDAAANDAFGKSVAVNGNYAVIGASGSDNGSPDTGSAYVYKKDSNGNWLQEIELIANDAHYRDYFGGSVDIDNNNIVIGANANDDSGVSSGAAYIYDLATFSEIKILASDANAGDLFGAAVTINNDRAIIGAYGYDNTYTNQGAAYVFDYNGSTWEETAIISSNRGNTDARFGISVAMSDDNIVVGSYGDDVFGSYSGTTYFFQNSCSSLSTERSSSNNLVKNNVTAIESVEKTSLKMKEEVTIYPNPSSNGVLNIVLQEKPKTLAYITVTDMLGNVVLKKEGNNSKIKLNIVNQSTGVYFVKIQNGENLTVKRVVIR